MSFDAPTHSGRVRNLTVVRPIVYGNTAKYFGRKRETDGHTHQWRLYVKPYYSEDASLWIRKVVFKLHETISDPVRTVEKPPYEVVETGWGEFEAAIKIHFVDPAEKPVTAYHVVRLFKDDALVMQGKKSLVCEYYDELVFQEPTHAMLAALKAAAGPNDKRLIAARHETDYAAANGNALQTVLDGRERLRAEITDLRESLTEASALIEQHGKQLAELEKSRSGESGTEPSASEPMDELPIAP